MKYILLLAVYLTGCGTVTTVVQSDMSIGLDLKKSKTSCVEIPRVYSGAAYDFCKVDSMPETIGPLFWLEFYVFDLPISIIADTIVLPFTGYQQATKGNIKVK